MASDPKHSPAPGSDRFDAVRRTRRVGVHRAVEKTGSTAVWVVTAILLTLILTALGVLIYTVQPSTLTFGSNDDSSSSPQATVESEIDPETTVVVLNGTDIASLAFTVDEVINAEGWGTVLYAGDASEESVDISAIFYTDPADEGVAKGLGEMLGGVATYQNPNYSQDGNQLTVLLGSDYNGPGLEEAKAADEAPQPEEQAPEAPEEEIFE